MKYEPPFSQQPDERTYYTTLSELSPTFNDFTAKKSKLIADANPPKHIENDRRVEIIKYFVDNRRAFNYSKEPRDTDHIILPRMHMITIFTTTVL